MPTNVKITIVVLTYNNEDTIYRCLKAISKQNFPKYEYSTLILDNGSTDNTLNIVKQFNYPFYVFPHLTIAQLRNKGVKLAQTQVVGFVDSDCEIYSDWIANGLKWFEKKDVAVLGFKYRLPHDATYFEKSWYGTPPNKITQNTLIPAGNMLVSRNIFNIIGGFNESLVTGEDAYLLEEVHRKGYLSVSDPNIKSIHYGNPKTIRQIYKREVWYGIGGGSIKHRIKSLDKPFLLSNFVLILILFFAYGLLTLKHSVMLTSIGLFFPLSLISAIDRRFIKGINGRFWYMILVYIVYFLARTTSLLYIYNIRRFRKA